MAKKRSGNDADRIIAALEHPDSDLEDIAQNIYKHGDRTLIQDIRETFALSSEIDNVKGPLSFLPDYFKSGLILTSNYDPLIEKVYQNRKINIEPQTRFNFYNFESASVKKDGIELCKIHGNYNGQDLTLLKRHYDNLYGEGNLNVGAQFTQAIQKLIETKTILFIGSSLIKDRTLRIFYDLYQKRHDGTLPEHFAFVTKILE